MTTYAAFLRGIYPSNPNMRNRKLKGVFESLGFENVRTLLSSGNVIFESSFKNAAALETKIEKALEKSLKIKSRAFIRSRAELERLIKKAPFKGASHSSTTYLIVTFIRTGPREIFNSIDITHSDGSAFMRHIEKQYGKDVTTRTWKTVGSVVGKMIDG